MSKVLSGSWNVYEFTVEFFCICIFYVVLDLLQGQNKSIPFRARPSPPPSCFNLCLQNCQCGQKLAHVLLVQQLPLVKQPCMALVVSCSVVLVHRVLFKCVQVNFSHLFLYFCFSSIIWYILCWSQGRRKIYSVYRIKNTVSVWSVQFIGTVAARVWEWGEEGEQCSQVCKTPTQLHASPAVLST